MTDIPERQLLELDIQNKDKKGLEVSSKNELEIKQTEALQVLSEAAKQIASFLTDGGLVNVLSGYARTQAVKDMLGGLTANMGRDALDARTISQNAIEITEVIEAVFKKYEEKLKTQNRDPEIHDAEADYKKYREKNP